MLSGDSDDDGGPNTYDYNDSFIDDKEEGKELTEYWAVRFKSYV